MKGKIKVSTGGNFAKQSSRSADNLAKRILKSQAKMGRGFRGK